MQRGNRNTQHTHGGTNNPDLSQYSEQDQQRVPMNPPYGQLPQSQLNTTADPNPHRSPTNRGTLSSFGSQTDANLQAPPPQSYGNFPVQPSSSSGGQSPHAPGPYVISRSAQVSASVGRSSSTLSPQAINMGSNYAAGMRGQPPIAAQVPQSPAVARVTGNPLSTNNSGRPQCRIPRCTQPTFFDNHIQEQLDYCEEHIYSSVSEGFAALCRRCNRLPTRDDSKYCSQACGSAEGGGSMVRQPSVVPHGFAASCQECRRPMPPNTNQHFCSMECETASLQAVRPSRR
ncbi:hypothetical protein BC827DRAFT_723211 [Russula dissimulans]|nr:hypothetical protein BC827DRAFT_723211 [Russula dissimulans]